MRGVSSVRCAVLPWQQIVRGVTAFVCGITVRVLTDVLHNYNSGSYIDHLKVAQILR
jgi:hypothetical protein